MITCKKLSISIRFNVKAFNSKIKMLDSEKKSNMLIRSDAISSSHTSLVMREKKTSDSSSSSAASRRSIVSSTTNRDSVSLKHYDCLLGELRCPGCSKPMYAPIKLCAGGHSICEICTIKLPNCPLCLEDFLNVRSYTLEALASKAFFTCSNVGKGCTVRLPRELMKWHKEKCIYKTGECFMGKVWGGCDWNGCEIDWMKHCTENHEEKIYFDSKMEATWNYSPSKYPRPVLGYYIFKIFGETFNLYHIYDKNASKYYSGYYVKILLIIFFFMKNQPAKSMWTLICASKDPFLKEKFAYEVELYSPMDPSKLLLQRQSCNSEKDEDILEVGRCATFLMGDVMRFLDKNKVSFFPVMFLR